MLIIIQTTPRYLCVTWFLLVMLVGKLLDIKNNNQDIDQTQLKNSYSSI